MGTLSLLLITGAAGRTASGRFLGGLIAGTAGRAASSRFLGGLVTGTTGGAASGGLFGGLVTGTTGGAASSGLFGGLVTGTASRSRSGCLRLFVPAKEIRKSHNCYLQNVFSGLFAPVLIILLGFLTGTSTHYFITQSPFCNFYVFSGDFGLKKI